MKINFEEALKKSGIWTEKPDKTVGYIFGEYKF